MRTVWTVRVVSEPDLASLLCDQQPPSQCDEWTGSRFEWLRRLPSRAKGSAAERFVAAAVTEAGAAVTAPTSRDADLVVDGVRVEVKSSTVWSNGELRFQQLRDQAYDVVVFVGVSPRDVSLWVASKVLARRHARGQHTGAAATETSWVAWTATTPPDWVAAAASPLELRAAITAASS